MSEPFAPQGSGAWLRARIGHLTASRMAAAMGFRKDGKETADRAALKIEILAERLSDTAAEHYVTPAMQWGLAQEPYAKEAYEEISGNLIQEAGFILHPRIELFGGSPDGLIDADGMLEAKCPTTQTHIGWMFSGVVPSEYKPQMLANIVCTGRQWCDFVSYDPRLPERKRLFVRRYEPTAAELHETALKDPTVQAAVQILGGEVREVRPRNRPRKEDA